MSDDTDNGPDSSADTLPLPAGSSLITLPTEQMPSAFTDGIEDSETQFAESPQRYRRQHTLGRGGNGLVISVFDKKMQRPVALKIANTSAAERSAKVRFLREAQVTGQLSHPNVMPVYDIGADTEGQVFFTMKEVQGKSLQHRIHAKTAGSLVERLMVFRQVCNAIAFAHSRGVLHRDIKPANVMVGEFGEVLVVDWGLCKVLGESIEDYRDLAGDMEADALTTREGEITGTPAYMAPEQALGDNDKLSPRTDVYALGALLYTLLTDQAPFSGDVADVLIKVARGDVVPAHEVRGGVPVELSAIAARAMKSRPEDRYANVGQLSSDVQAYLEQRPVSVFRYSLMQRAAKWAERNKRVVRPVAFTAALALVVLFSGALLHYNRVAEARDLAIAEAARATRAERLARIEALNGRAALAASEALTGRAGAALEQLRSLRTRLVKLDADTLRADVGMAMVKRSAVVPWTRRGQAPDGEAPNLSFSDSGEEVAWIANGEIQILGRASGDVLRSWPLPSDTPPLLGPWEGGVPWVVTLTGRRLEGWHPASGRVISLGDDSCRMIRRSVGKRWIAAWCDNQTLRTWAWDTMESVGRFGLDAVEVRPQAVSDDGRRILALLYKDSYSQHDSRPVVLEEGREIWADEGRSTVMALAPSGRWLVTSSPSGFELHDIDRRRSESVQAEASGAFLWSADSTRFRVVTQSGVVTEYAVGRGGLVQNTQVRFALTGSVQYAAADAGLTSLALSSDEDISLYEGEPTNTPIADLQLSTESLATVEAALSPGGELIAVGTENGTIYLLDAESGIVLRDLARPDRPVRGLSFSPDSARLISGHWDGAARIWDLRTGEVVREFRPTKDSPSGGTPKVTEVLFLDDDRVLLTGGDGHLGIWSSSSGELLQDFSGAVKYAWDSSFSPTGQRLLVTDRLGFESDRRGVVIDLSTAATRDLEGAVHAYGSAVSPDGEYFVVTAETGPAWVYNQRGEPVTRLEIPTPPSLSASWSADGSLVAVSDFSGNYQIWETDTWDLVASFGQGILVSSLLFERSGRSLRLVTHSGEIYALDLNPSDRPVATGPAWLQAARDRVKAGELQAAHALAAAEPAENTLAQIWVSALSQRSQDD